jgi:hypothetical protein
MFRRALGALTGDTEYSVTVPPMDGALNPNNQLEQAAVVATADAPDNLCLFEEKLLFSSAGAILELDPAAAHAVPKQKVAWRRARDRPG